MWTAISAVISGVGSYFKGNQEIKAAKVAGEVAKLTAEANAAVAVSEAKITMAKNAQANNYDLDKIAMQNMKTSYKDEFLLGLFSIPMVLAFIPEMDTVVTNGFNAIDKMPDWYVYLYGGMVIVIYGLRSMFTKMLENKKSILPGK